MRIECIVPKKQSISDTSFIHQVGYFPNLPGIICRWKMYNTVFNKAVPVRPRPPFIPFPAESSVIAFVISSVVFLMGKSFLPSAIPPFCLNPLDSVFESDIKFPFLAKRPRKCERGEDRARGRAGTRFGTLRRFTLTCCCLAKHARRIAESL